jgi:hypothetical protein
MSGTVHKREITKYSKNGIVLLVNIFPVESEEETECLINFLESKGPQPTMEIVQLWEQQSDRHSCVETLN